MDQASHDTETASEPAGTRLTLEAERLLAYLEEAWPEPGLQRDIANLPRSVAAALSGKGSPRRLARLMAHLDRTFPGWAELAASALAQACRADHGPGPAPQRLSALLAHRPLRRPEVLLDALDHSAQDSEWRFWLLAALVGTDAAPVRAACLRHLRSWIAGDQPSADHGAWFAFLRAFLRGWLTWGDFRDCLARAQVLSAAHPKGDYRRALDQLGLSSHPLFTKWYRQVIYEVTHQPDVSLSSRAGGWIRDFPGEDYLWDALAQLEARPDSWWPLHVLRWTSGVNPEDDRVISHLREYSPLILSLLSLLRPNLCPAAARALALPEHEPVIAWLKTTHSIRPLDIPWVEATLTPWVETMGEPTILAAGALCSLEPPLDFIGPASATLRRRAFLRAHLLPEFDRLMDNLCYLHALRKEHFEIIASQARKGRPAAVRALSLWPEKAEETAPLLFRLTREGSQPVRQAARQALDLLRIHSGVPDLERFEKRVDLASAWADAGLEGKPARVWWNVAGHHIKLSVAAGAVSLQAYSGSQRLPRLPRAVRQDPRYHEIRQIRGQLARSYRYFRRRFEQAMVEGLQYGAKDFSVLLANPVVASLASRLILFLDGAAFLWSPADPLDPSHPRPEVEQAAHISIAHPLALSPRGLLSHWQQRVIDSRLGQPFKQVFRELYLVGESELASTSCLRFAGHPLIARRAFALLRTRGYSPGRGDALKEWSSHGLHAHIRWAQPYENAGRLLTQPDPADAVTSGPIWFASSGEVRVPLAEVPPIIFSETLRDADLLVSRAPAGELGFTSEETRRLRATLVRYLTRALGLTSIYVSEDCNHVIVEGRRAMYRIHLGSGSVFLENSRRHLDLAAIANKQMEDLLAESMDSRTAHILGLIAALTQDHQIADPHFLRQLGHETP